MDDARQPLSLLVVDDDRMIRLLLRRFIESLGHCVFEAGSGEEALIRLEETRPDIVLMDMVMPGMDGLTAAREIKNRVGERWVPVIFLTALDSDADLVTALAQGGDDYLTKPVNFPILRAKLAAFGRSVALNKRVREQAIELARYQDRSIEEQRVAQYLMNRIVNAAKLDDPMLESWLSPAEFLSGDLLAAARTPGDVLHVMLADGVGHGLTAALNVLPVTQPFYSMTEKGFSVAEIAREMNRQVRQVLPRDRFISAALVAVDLLTRRIEMWNGGIPKVWLFDRGGKPIHAWPSRHLPLGILPENQFESRTESYTLTEPGRLMMCSDGLIEAEAADGEPFGSERLMDVARHALPGQELSAVRDAVVDHLGGRPHHDDISLAWIRCDPALADARTAAPEDGEDNSVEHGWRLSLTLGAAELKTVHTVPLLIQVLDQLHITRRQRSEVFLILSELVSNALEHGLLGLNSTQKEAPEGVDLYFAARERGLAELTHGEIRVDLAATRHAGEPVLAITVSDTGRGFHSPDRLPDASALTDGRRSGKGLALARALCTDMRFNEAGNEVSVLYPLTHRRSPLTVQR